MAERTQATPGVFRWVRPAGRGARKPCPVWRAHIQVNGVRVSRDFAVSFYGEEGARRRAVRARRAWLKESGRKR